MTTRNVENIDINLPNLIYALWKKLKEQRKMQIIFLFCFVLASAFSEVFSLGSVLPFLYVLINPIGLWNLTFFRNIFIFLGINNPNYLLLPMTVIFCLCIVFAAFFRLVTIWLNCRLSAAIGSDLSCEVFTRTIFQPYKYHLERNSSELIAAINIHIPQSIYSINLFFKLISNAIIASSIIIALLIINLKIALSLIIVFGFAYLLISIFIKNKLAANSLFAVNATQNQLSIIQESLGGIRDLIIDQNFNYYIKKFIKYDKPLRIRDLQNEFLGSFPKYALEALGMILIAVLGFLIKSLSPSTVNAIPLLGTIALGAQRLLPSLQQVFTSWSAIKAKQENLKKILDILDRQNYNKNFNLGYSEISFNKELRLSSISFKHLNQKKSIFENIHLTINKGECLGIIGTTGSGKSTFIDIVMGLLIGSQGYLKIDGLNLYSGKDSSRKIRAWMSKIAHVPQSIFLSDSTIAENIAFGIELNNIDYRKLKNAIEAAQLNDFIESLPNKYNTFVGERGVKLSGGQRQRIGIARAFYKNPQILILDEATSALDIRTERKIMEKVNCLSKDLTIIIIAHRHSTLKNCDRVIEINGGKIIKEGLPKDVLY